MSLRWNMDDRVRVRPAMIGDNDEEEGEELEAEEEGGGGGGSDEDVEWVVERVVGKRIHRGEIQYRIKWRGYPDSDNSWEPEENCNCPDLIADFERAEERRRENRENRNLRTFANALGFGNVVSPPSPSASSSQGPPKKKKKAEPPAKNPTPFSGPGQQLKNSSDTNNSTNAASTSASSSSSSQPGCSGINNRNNTSNANSNNNNNNNHGNQSQSSSKTPPTEAELQLLPDEKKNAALAALARVDKEKILTDPSEALAKRRSALIKAQALKELEEEARLRQLENGNSNSNPSEIETESSSTSTSGKRKNSEQDEFPAGSYTINRVLFRCPFVGEFALPKEEVEERLYKFLQELAFDDPSSASCLMIHSSNEDEEKISACVNTLSDILDNLINHPEETKYQKIKCSNRIFQERVLPLKGTLDFLTAAGFSKGKPCESGGGEEEEYFMWTNRRDTSFLRTLQKTLKETERIPIEIDRNLQILRPAEVKEKLEFPPEFYILSPEEVKREQQRRREVAERELCLRTKATREKEDLREQRLYRYAVIRIRFPDDLILQGIFGASEKVEQVFKFTSENLCQEYNGMEFTLKKPGGESLDTLSSTIAEAHLPPASLLHFQPIMENNGSVSIISSPFGLATSYLKSELVALVASQQVPQPPTPSTLPSSSPSAPLSSGSRCQTPSEP